MLQKKISGEQVNTMVSDQYEIYHVKDVVSQSKQSTITMISMKSMLH